MYLLLWHWLLGLLMPWLRLCRGGAKRSKCCQRQQSCKAQQQSAMAVGVVELIAGLGQVKHGATHPSSVLRPFSIHLPSELQDCL